MNGFTASDTSGKVSTSASAAVIASLSASVKEPDSLKNTTWPEPRLASGKVVCNLSTTFWEGTPETDIEVVSLPPRVSARLVVITKSTIQATITFQALRAEKRPNL